MSRYFSTRLTGIEPYTPGEQPKDAQYIKLNTNESPFPPAPGVLQALEGGEAARLNLYSDPTASLLVEAIAKRYGVKAENVFVGNGSDEVLAFAFYAYGEHGFIGPALSYGFYPVFAQFFQIPYTAAAMREDLSIDCTKFYDRKESIVLANPNAQTGLYLPPQEIEALLKHSTAPVIVDEAYIDFGGESAVPLIARFPNLLVTGTFSKSRNLAGARIGFAIGDAALITDLNTLKFSFNPYNLNRLSILAGAASMQDEAYFKACTAQIIQAREFTKQGLRALGFACTDSLANFVLAASPKMSGKRLYQKLKERGILVRYLGDACIQNYVRITIGTIEQMQTLLNAIEQILQEEQP